MSREVDRTDDGRYVRERLLHHLGVARAAVRKAVDDDRVAAARARVQLAKTGLGEPGPA